MLNDLINIRDNVQNLLIRYPQTRNSDRALIIKYAEEFVVTRDNKSFSGVMELMPSLEGITRVRRKLQLQFKELRADSDVTMERAEEDAKISDIMKGNTFNSIQLF